MKGFSLAPADWHQYWISAWDVCQRGASFLYVVSCLPSTLGAAFPARTHLESSITWPGGGSCSEVLRSMRKLGDASILGRGATVAGVKLAPSPPASGSCRFLLLPQQGSSAGISGAGSRLWQPLLVITEGCFSSFTNLHAPLVEDSAKLPSG